MKLRAFLLASTLLTTAGLARAEPVHLDEATLEVVRAGALRATFFVVGGDAGATAGGVVSQSRAEVSMDAGRRSMSSRSTSRAGAKLR